MAAKSKSPSKPKNKAVGEASYVIDDRGRVQIADGQQQISLERDDVRRLKVFLDTHSRA